jgi:hypothetical protein
MYEADLFEDSIIMMMMMMMMMMMVADRKDLQRTTGLSG